MTLPTNIEDYNYRFFKNLNEDVKLVSDEYGRWDIDFDNQNDDWNNCNGFDSMVNACIIAIMTRFDELGFMELYDDFGCRVHELIKDTKSKQTEYHIELFIAEVLNNIRRVKKVNWVDVTEPMNQEYNYKVAFSITCRIDEDSDGDEDEVETVTIEEEIII